MSKTLCKVMFGFWAAFIGYVTTLAVFSFTSGSFDIKYVVIVVCAVNICQLYWKLWHVEDRATPVIINVYERNGSDS